MTDNQKIRINSCFGNEFYGPFDGKYRNTKIKGVCEIHIGGRRIHVDGKELKRIANKQNIKLILLKVRWWKYPRQY